MSILDSHIPNTFFSVPESGTMGPKKALHPGSATLVQMPLVTQAANRKLIILTFEEAELF
jgi:hypothetical protein